MDAVTLGMLLDYRNLQESFRTAMQEICAPQIIALDGVVGNEERPYPERRMAETLRAFLAEILRLQGFSLPGMNSSRPDADTASMALRQLMTTILTSADWPLDTADKMVAAMTDGSHRTVIASALQSYLGIFTTLLSEQPQQILARGQKI